MRAVSVPCRGGLSRRLHRRGSRDIRGARRRDARVVARAGVRDALPSGTLSTHRALGRFRRITTDMARASGIGLAVVILIVSTGTAWAQGGTLRVGLPSVSSNLDPATALEGPV